MKSYDFTNGFKNNNIECQKKGKKNEKEIYSMDMDNIYIVFGSWSRYNGKNKFKQATWCFGKWSG